jgi:hypothetical protein
MFKEQRPVILRAATVNATQQYNWPNKTSANYQNHPLLARDFPI